VNAPESFAPDAATTLHVRRSREGDLESLAWLVERFTPLLLAQARYRLGRHLRELYDPEDLVQEAWTIALPRLADLRPSGGRLTPVLLCFLSTTVLNRYGTLIQKHLLGKPLRAIPSGSGGALGDDPLALLPAEQTSVVSQAARNEASTRLVAALDELSERDREVIVLRSIEQVSVPTAAQLLGVTENALSVRHHRALQRLRERVPVALLEDLPGPAA
jgi:RNA polymerase sigma-70 factor (ECF subfamily)